MAQLKETVITNKGIALVTKLLNADEKLTFTRVISTDEIFDSSTIDLATIETISNVRQTGNIRKQSIVNDTETLVETLFLNTNLTEKYLVNTIALFALDPDDGEILFSITSYEIADTMPADNGTDLMGIKVNILYGLTQSPTPQVTIYPAGIVTNEQLIRLLKYNSGTKQVTYNTPTGPGSATVNYEKRFNRCFIHCDELSYIASTTQSGSFRSFSGLPYPAKFNQSFLVAKDTVIGIPLWINLTAGSTDFNVSSMAIYEADYAEFGSPFPSAYANFGNGGTMKFSFEYVTDDPPDDGYYDKIDELNQKLENALNGGI